MINTTKIAISNLKQNKSKSILIIITILLSTTLLASVAMTCVDWSSQNKTQIIRQSGTQHGVYSNMNENQVERIKTHANVEEVGLVNGLGVKKYDDETKIALSYVDDKSMEFGSSKIIEGRAPKKKNEIMLDEFAIEKLGYKKELGQKIVIEYEDSAKEGLTKGEFILTGITESDDMAKAKKVYMGIVSKEYMASTRDMSKENFSAYITIKNADKLSGDEIKYTVEKIGSDLEIPKGRVNINEDYINALKPDLEVIMWGVVISLVVILSSVLVIYNIFYLSVVTKVQEFGKLRAIGATKKQVKSIVLKEGMFLSLIGIPGGIILACFINEFILRKLFFSDINISKIPILVFVAIISLITVYVSLLKPMKVTSRVSIVEAIRYNGEDNRSHKNRKGNESINLKNLSMANIKRNKKRTYVTIISLSLSGIIFIVISSVMNSIDAEKRARVHFPIDICVNLTGFTFGEEDSPNTEMNILQMNNPLDEGFKKEIMSIDGVKEIDTIVNAKTEIKGYDTEYKYHELTSIDESYLEDMNSYLEDGQINMDKLKSGNFITINYPELASELGVKAGDKLTLIIYDGDKKIEEEFTIQAITSGEGTFGIHKDVLSNICENDLTTSVGIYTDKDKYLDVKKYITTITESNDYIKGTYIDESIESIKFSLAVTKAIGYSLVIIIGIIGFMNLINSMITSIITRKKELGMLQAIGLTNKQLIKMLNIEAMFYTGTMLASSLTIGTALGYIVVSVLKRFGMSYAQYSFPIIQVIIMVVSVIVAQLILTYLISKNFNKESLIDRVRYNE